MTRYQYKTVLRFVVLSIGKLGTATNGGPLSCLSVILVIIGGFICQLSKLLLKAVIVLFYGKSSIFQFIRALLSIGEVSTHQSLNGPPFGTVTVFCELSPANNSWLYLISFPFV